MTDDDSVLAVGVYEFGGPEALQPVRIRLPHAGPGQVRVRVRAAGMNPTDLFFRAGVRGQAALEPPYIPGMDFAGIIDEVGDGATWTPGERVMGITLPSTGAGGYTSRIVVSAESIARMPAGVDFAAAATLPMNGLTAVQILDRFALPAGATIGVTGGPGALGGYVIQLAKARGLRVIADAKPQDEALLRELGADVILSRGPGLVERLRDAEPEGVDGIVDAALLGPELLPAIKDGGHFAAVRGADWEPVRGITLHRIGVWEYAQEQAKLDRLRQQVEAGELTLRVAETIDPSQAADAHRRLEAGGLRGRIVMLFPED